MKDVTSFNELIQVVIIIVGLYLAGSISDLKNKVKLLGKLEEIDPLVKKVADILEKLNHIYSRQKEHEIDIDHRIKRLEEKFLEIKSDLEKLKLSQEKEWFTVLFFFYLKMMTKMKLLILAVQTKLIIS